MRWRCLVLSLVCSVAFAQERKAGPDPFTNVSSKPAKPLPSAQTPSKPKTTPTKKTQLTPPPKKEAATHKKKTTSEAQPPSPTQIDSQTLSTVEKTDGETKMSLHEVIWQALGSNPKVLTALANEKAEQATIVEAKAGYLPKLDLNLIGGIDRTRLPTSSTYNRLRYRERNVTISQMLFDGGNTTNTVKSSRSKFLSKRQQTYEQRLDIAEQATTAYVDILRYRRILRLAQDNVKKHQAILKKVVAKYVGGAGTRADTELAESRKYQAQATLISARNSLANAISVFNEIVGIKPPNLQEPKVLGYRLPKDLKSASTIALSHHPAIRSAREELHSKDADIMKARAAFMPTVFLELSGSDDDNVDGIAGANRQQQGLLEFRYNLFNGGADKANERNATEKKIAAEQTLESTEREVHKNVEQAWHNFKASEMNLKQYVRRVKTQEKVLEDYEKQLKLGKRSLLNVLDIERELFQARIQLINGSYNLIDDSYILLASMGILTDALH